MALRIQRYQCYVDGLFCITPDFHLIPPPAPLSSTARYSRPVIRTTDPSVPGRSYDQPPLPMRPKITSLHVLEKFLKKAISCRDVELAFYLLPMAPACSVRRILHWALRKRKPEVNRFLHGVVYTICLYRGQTGYDGRIPCGCVVHANPEFTMNIFTEDREYDRETMPISYEDLTELEQNILKAVHNKNFALMYALLAPVRHRDVRNLLMYAAELCDSEIMRILAQSVHLDKSDAGLFVYTIRRGFSRHLQGLLAAGFPANCPVFDDLPVLMLKMPSLQHYHTLLKMGADPNLRYEKNDSLVKTAFMAAMMRGDVKLMEILLDYGAVIDGVVGKSDFVFELACTPHFNVSLILLLLDQGLDINVCNKYGETLVHAAVLHSNYELMCLLIERGADVNIADRDGVTPLIRSARIGKKFTDRLLVAGADINAVDRWSRNVLVAWTLERNESAVLSLLDLGVNCDLCNEDWGTPLLLSLKLPLPFNNAIDKMLSNMSDKLAKKSFMNYQATGIPSALSQAVVDMCRGNTHSIRSVKILLRHRARWHKDPNLKNVLIHAIVSTGSFPTFELAIRRRIRPRDCSVKKLRSCLDMPIVSCCTDKVSPLYVALYFGYWPLAKFMLKIHYLTPSDTRIIAGHSCLYEHLSRFECTRTLALLKDFQKWPLPLEALTLIKVSSTFLKAPSRNIRQFGLPEPVISVLAYDQGKNIRGDPLIFECSERNKIHGLNKNYRCPCPVKGRFFR